MSDNQQQQIVDIIDSLINHLKISNYSNTIMETSSSASSTINRTMSEAEKKQIEYIIGIDLGHGETSAAICPMQWETAVEQLDPAKDLDMGGNKKVMPSAITILDNGNAYIGAAAFNPEILKQANVRVCFKQAPKNVNGDAEKIMIRFMHEVYKRIRENNKAVLTDTNHLVYIATPSGWDKPTQDLYVEMARMAELPIAGVTKESRAAFVRAQHDVTSGLGRNIDKGSIVFDMGSSTLDFTYMNKNLSGLIDHGYDCGASFIEKSIYAQQQEESDAIKQFEAKYPKLTDYLIFEARKVKEQVYFDPSLKVKKTINFDDFIDDEDLEDERFKLTYQPGELNEFLEGNGYIKSIEDAMIDYKQNHIANQEIYGVFLTGGASRMDFIIPLVCKCWGVEPSQVYRDQDPSLTISQGVAEVARMDLRTDGIEESLSAEIDRIINSDMIYELFVNKFGADYWDRVTEAIAQPINNFPNATGTYQTSINSLKTQIQNGVNNVTENYSKNIPEFLRLAIEEGTCDIRAKVDEIVSNYSVDKLAVPQLCLQNIPTINMPNISLDKSIEEIANQIPDDIVKFSAGNAAAGAAAGAAIGSFVPILGTITGALIGGAIGAMTGEASESEKRTARFSKACNDSERQMVFEYFSKNWETITNNVADTILSSLNNSSELKQSVTIVVKQMLSEYKESLKSARLLID